MPKPAGRSRESESERHHWIRPESEHHSLLSSLSGAEMSTEDGGRR